MSVSLSSRAAVLSAVLVSSLSACALESEPPTPGSGGVGGSGLAGSGGATGGKGGSMTTGGTAGSATGGTGGTAGTTALGGKGGSGGGGAGGGGTAGAGASGGMSSGGAGASGASGAGVGGGGAGGEGSGGDTGAGMGGGGAGGASAGGAAGASGMGSGGAAGAGGASDTKSAGCGKMPGIPSNMYNNGQPISIMAGNMQRRYILAVPQNYDNNKPYKLIIAYHQLDGNDRQMYANDYYHLRNLSNNSAIFVAPNGQKNGSPCTVMNNGDGGCGWPNGGGSDIALADAVVNAMKENFCIDTNRIFATGWSYGGSMSYKTACERGLGGTKNNVPGYIRAIAVYSGAQLSGQCTPTTPVAYYGSHGDNDGVLTYGPGVALAGNFAMANGCNWSAPPAVTSGNHVCRDIAGCPANYPVKFCSFDGDHTPDPRDPGQQTSWQYQVVWDWFNQF